MFHIDPSPELSYIVQGLAEIGGKTASGKITKEKGINPQLAFRFIKSKFGMLEKIYLERRLKKLEKAFYEAVENGLDFFGEKILKELSVETKESALYAKKIRYYIDKKELDKIKYKIKGGHISDTKFKNYTRIIPKDILKRKKELEDFFDDFVIYHYYNKELEEKVESKQKMSEEERSNLKDPILFGTIKENSRLYFIADWEDDQCDLTFDEIIDYVSEEKINKNPNLLDKYN